MPMSLTRTSNRSSKRRTASSTEAAVFEQTSDQRAGVGFVVHDQHAHAIDFHFAAGSVRHDRLCGTGMAAINVRFGRDCR